MSNKKYTYQIALSFAVEDLEIAEEIAKELKRLEISNYIFTQENDNLALNLKAETWRVYREESRFAVMLISKNYVNKKWATEEREIIQTVDDSRKPYLIPIRIDDTPVPGLTENTIYTPWKKNASYIAISLWRLIKKKALKPSLGIEKISKEKNSTKTNKKSTHIEGSNFGDVIFGDSGTINK